HSSLMLPAERRLELDLAATSFAKPSTSVYVNVDAVPVSSADAARDALVRQVSRPVRWEQSVHRMVEDGGTLFVEIGPGKVLCGMITRITDRAKALGVQEPADFESVRAAIAEARAH